MEPLFLIAGIIILLLVIVDVLWTTLWVDGGAGPISNPLAMYTWKAMRKVSGDHTKTLSLAGPAILVLTLLTWILMLWAGWLLLFTGDTQSIVDTRDNQPIDWLERIYFTGFVIFTLGVGDYVPNEGFWQAATAVASGNGMLFITLGVTYVLSVLGAVTQQRSFASSITGVGKSANQFVSKAWNGKDFHNADLLLNTVSSEVSVLASQHKAYPILRYYYSSDQSNAASIGVTILDEALTIFERGIPEDNQPNGMLMEDARSAISSYIDAIPVQITGSDAGIPPSPDLSSLQQSGLPTVPADQFTAELEELESRRKKLSALIELDARKWPDGGQSG